jgi:peptidoglycan LD-endopeptidase CwlK
MSRDLFLPRDRRALIGVQPEIIQVLELARPRAVFIVVQGVRTIEQQRQLVAAGRSRSMRSRHLTGHAVDLAPWQNLDADRAVDPDEIDWDDFAGFRALSRVILTAARELGVELVWGGNWPTLRDGPHYELDRIRYPARGGA